ncbi:MAG: dTMP kinase [Euryarchaeota archaeon]|nr:dTMP kinase [Euryarchaeota archaeon]
MRGRFVTFEGIDGCGKTTVSKKVLGRLRKRKVRAVWTCEPTRTWLGNAVRRGWAEGAGVFTEAFLFMADRSEHVDEICARMGKGQTVLCDRYLDSTLAYQAAGVDEDLTAGMMDWLRRAHLPFLLLPDLTIYIRVRPELGLSRISGRKGRTKFERLAFLGRVARNYDALAAAEPQRMKVVDGSGPLDGVVELCLAEIGKIL